MPFKGDNQKLIMEVQVTKFLREIYRIIRDVILFPMNLFHIKNVINNKTYYPEKERKSKGKRIAENILCLLKYHEVNIYYNSYGLDVKDFHDENNYIPHRKFVLSREQGNQKVKCTETGKYNYIVLLRDKYVFAAYLASTLGKKYIPQNIGVLDNKKVFLIETNTWVSREEFFSRTFQCVFKKIDGECAEGVYLVKVSDGIVEHDGVKENWKEYCKTISNSRILIQKIIQQHEKVAKLNPNCVNTIRIVTLSNRKQDIGVFSAFLRLGITKDSFVDNRAKGGVGVGIDLDTGCLKTYGFAHDAFGTKLDAHPLTGVIFKNYQIPYWEEIKKLAKDAHKQFYELQSIGWDIVVTPTGPVILEGNDDWEIGGPQDTEGGLRQKWMELTETRI